jgi:hypothetical protein
MKPRWWLLIACPVAIGAAFSWLELDVLADREPGVAMKDPVDAVNAAISLNTDLAKLFIGIATSLIGAVAYYLTSRKKDFASDLPATSIVTVVCSVVAAVFSIYFGHLMLVYMRNQLANEYFNPFASALVWSERGQFLCLVAALCWFALLVVERETRRSEGSATRA